MTQEYTRKKPRVSITMSTHGRVRAEALAAYKGYSLSQLLEALAIIEFRRLNGRLQKKLVDDYEKTHPSA